MTDEEIEKALQICGEESVEQCGHCPIEQVYKNDCRCGSVLAKRVLAYINRLKAENAALTEEADENAALAIEQKMRTDKLYEKLQSNLEAAYEHNTEECKRCMDKVEVKQQCAEEALKEQIRKETAREILQVLYEEAMRYRKTTDGIKHMAHKYGVEVGK